MRANKWETMQQLLYGVGMNVAEQTSKRRDAEP